MSKLLCAGLVILAIASGCVERTNEDMTFDEYPYYVADDLGMVFNMNEIKYRLWSPTADEVRLNIYDSSIGGEVLEQVNLAKSTQGSWMVSLDKELEGKYYTVQIKVDGNWREEVPGPYAKAVGTNGLRGHIVNPADFHPEEDVLEAIEADLAAR